MPDAIQATIALLGICNLASFLAFWWDKSRSRRNKERIPEARLLQLTLLGPFGSIPGIWWIRHKTQKGSFLFQYFLALFLSLACHAGLAYLALFTS